MIGNQDPASLTINTNIIFALTSILWLYTRKGETNRETLAEMMNYTVELGPGAVIVIFALIQVKHLDITPDHRLNVETASMNLWAEHRYSLQGCPSLWCHRTRLVWTWILLVGVDWIINIRNGVASRADCWGFKSLLFMSFRELKSFESRNWR